MSLKDTVKIKKGFGFYEKRKLYTNEPALFDAFRENMCGLTTPMEGSLMCPLERLSNCQTQARFKLSMTRER